MGRIENYRAVNLKQLKMILGYKADPKSWCEGYVIGPDTTGKLMQVTCRPTLQEAARYAESMNKNTKYMKLKMREIQHINKQTHKQTN